MPAISQWNINKALATLGKIHVQLKLIVYMYIHKLKLAKLVKILPQMKTKLLNGSCSSDYKMCRWIYWNVKLTWIQNIQVHRRNFSKSSESPNINIFWSYPDVYIKFTKWNLQILTIKNITVTSKSDVIVVCCYFHKFLVPSILCRLFAFDLNIFCTFTNIFNS